MKKEIFKKAHSLTKKIIRKGDSYRATFKLALSFVYSQIKKGVNKVVELKGTEKQVKWAEDIRNKFMRGFKDWEVVAQNYADREEKFQLVINDVKELKNKVENEEDSKWFINNKDFVSEYTILGGLDRDVVKLNLKELLNVEDTKYIKRISNMYRNSGF